MLGAVLLGGFAWYERSRPPSQVVALVAALAALAVAGRLAFCRDPQRRRRPPTSCCSRATRSGRRPASPSARSPAWSPTSGSARAPGPRGRWRLGALRPRSARSSRWRRRDIGRFGLAVACGFAGVAFGALMNFSLMATYGGELSLERFLALEARAIPFDAAHAIGNFTLALIAGPAMVRMLVRFRERFEWKRAPRRAHAARAARPPPRPARRPSPRCCSPPSCSCQRRRARRRRRGGSWLARAQNRTAVSPRPPAQTRASR